MVEFLGKLRGYHHSPKITKEDAELEKFFTDAEHARQVFERLTSTTISTKYMLVIHGIGAVGKSSLLKMYRLHCKKTHIPVALALCEDVKSEVSILSRWADNLNTDGIELKNFANTFKHYHAIKAKATELAGKIAVKTTEATHTSSVKPTTLL